MAGRSPRWVPEGNGYGPYPPHYLPSKIRDIDETERLEESDKIGAGFAERPGWNCPCWMWLQSGLEKSPLEIPALAEW